MTLQPASKLVDGIGCFTDQLGCSLGLWPDQDFAAPPLEDEDSLLGEIP